MTDKFYRIILASLLVTSTWWRHCLTLHFFFRKHCTCHTNSYMGKRNNCISLRIYLWKMPCGKCWKWHCRETKFRNFLEEHPSLKCLQRSNFYSRAYTFKISRYASAIEQNIMDQFTANCFFSFNVFQKQFFCTQHRDPAIYRCMVADNCHTSKRHKFVSFRLNLNYFVLENKAKVKRQIILYFIELEIDSFC